MEAGLSPFTPPQFLMAAMRSSLGSDLDVPGGGNVNLLSSEGGGGGGAGAEAGGAIGGRDTEAVPGPGLAPLLPSPPWGVAGLGGAGALGLPCLPVLGLPTASLE